MELLAFDHQGRRYLLLASSWSGVESLRVDGHEISRRRCFGFSNRHEFEWPEGGRAELRYRVDAVRGRVRYELLAGERPLQEGVTELRLPATARRLLEGVTEAETALVPASGLGGHLRTALTRPWVVKSALAAASFVTGALLLDVWSALMVIGLIAVHEAGHLWAMRRFGLRRGGLYLLPLIGGLATGERPRTPGQAAVIALMGPVFGFLASLMLLAVFLLTGEPSLGLAGTLGVEVNLLNLLPLYPLDGGRVLVTMLVSGRGRRGAGVLLAVAAVALCAALWWASVVLGLVALLGVVLLASAWQAEADPADPGLEAKDKVMVLLGYLGTGGALLGLLALMVHLKVPGTAWLW